ncbi:MAG: hypothetical protein QM728_12560 [Gordonia sp. (in: high G+C Gram-positive bacteria)]|uniref:hypothetical protein n=1 Tax=Gordonia sp. (in: high G+C Gram-positive bacteria) TaxID=84139 RepID=UPI0039E6E36C
MAKDDPESRPIPASELLARKREAANAAEDTGEIPRVAFPRSASPTAQRATGGVTASGMPAFAPAEPAEPTTAESNRVTGVIPSVDHTIASAESAPATGSIFRGQDDIDFESYRNFDDVIATEEPTEKKGLFARRKRKEKDKGKAKAKGRTKTEEPVDEAPAPRTAATPVEVAHADTGPIQPVAVAPAEDTASLAPVDDEDLVEVDVPVVEHAPLVDPVTGRFAAPAAAAAAATAEEEAAPAVTPSVTRRPAGAEAAAPLVDDDEDEEKPRERRRRRKSKAKADKPAKAATAKTKSPKTKVAKATTATATDADDSDTAVVDESPLASEYSPLMQWVILIGQMLGGLVFGAAAFWGFVQLWRWNVYFALVAAALVIFGIVTLVHIVRRRHDLATTLLALGVGLFITIGPLILLATS